MKVFWVLMFAAVTAALTIVVRIPVPGTGGYLNAGDMAVVFCGLFLGGRWGAVAGGLGSAAADVIGGFFIFAPVTLVAKGIEGFIAGHFGRRNLYLGVLFAVLMMVIIYFIAESFLPGMGFAAALSELPFNLIQAAIGGIGGIIIYRGIRTAFP